MFIIIATLLCIYALFVTKKDYLLILGISVSLDLISHYAGFFTIKLFMLVLGVGFIRLGLTYYEKHFDKNYNNTIKIAFFLIAAIIMYYLISSSFAINQGYHLTKTIQYVIIYSTMFIVVIYAHNDLAAFTRAILALKLSTIINASYGLLQIAFYYLNFNDKAIFLNNFSYSSNISYQVTQWTVEIGQNAVPRATGFFNDPSIFGGLLLCGWPFFLIKNHSLSWKYNNIFAGIVLLAIAFTFSRSVWLAFFVQVILVLFFANKRWLLIKQTYVWACLLFFAITTIITEFGNIFIQRIMHTFDLYNHSTAGHLLFAEEGIEMFYQNPILGVGLGNFSEYLGYYGMSHSLPITILSEQGILGLLLMSLFFILLLSVFFRMEDKQLKVVFLLSLLGLLAGNIGYDYHTQAYIWFFLGILLASTSRSYNLLIKKEIMLLKKMKPKE